jgi:hypothetical protein
MREELAGSRDRAEALFKDQRRNEGPVAFETICIEVEPVVSGQRATC